MTHKERMAALVEAGEASGVSDEDGHADWFSEEDRKFHMACTAARPTIALALEIIEALKDWRECERQMNNVSNNTNDYLNASNALGVAFKRLDELLAQWEEGK